jgi:hypothetical protein
MTMSNYVNIGTSVSDIISIANDLRDQGRTLNETMKTAVQRVEHGENDHDTFPPDEFTDTFLENYHKPVEGGGGEHANAAVKKAATTVGDGMVSLGDYVANAMFSYQGQDIDSGTDIANTDV